MITALEVKGLNVRYGKISALHAASISVDAGQIVTIIGANGAGKTSLLKAIMGLIPSTGSIELFGHAIGSLDVVARVSSGLLLVPESSALFTDMSVADNLLLGAYLYRHEKKETNAELEKVYDLFPRLRERKSQLAGTMSGGERQMLALGRALMGRPRVLMLDEPSLGLAPIIVREIFTILARLRTMNVTTVLVEQNARAALETADIGYVIETGEIIKHGPSGELLKDPRLAEIYLGGDVGESLPG